MGSIGGDLAAVPVKGGRRKSKIKNRTDIWEGRVGLSFGGDLLGLEDSWEKSMTSVRRSKRGEY